MPKPFALLLLAASTAFAAPGLTIYNADFAVVRDSVPLDLKAGDNEVTYEGATLLLEPDSVVLRSPSGAPLRILEQNYRNDALTQPYLLSLFEGQNIDFTVREPQKPDRTISAKIIRSGYGTNTEPVVEVDGKIQFGLPGQPIFPSLGDGTILKPRLAWKIAATEPLKGEAELGYITGGLSWLASYNLVSPEKGGTIDLTGWITMQNNSGRDFTGARTKLMAGDVSKFTPAMDSAMPRRMMAMAAAPEADAVTEKAFDEFHLYTLPRPVTLRDRETKQVEFARASGVQSEVLYIYDALGDSLGRYGGADARFRAAAEEMGSDSQNKIAVVREIKNSKENNLGIPLPKGRVRFYRADGDQLEFTGENFIGHTPADETIKLRTGDAFDLVGERKRTLFRVDNANRRTTEEFQITLRNRKKEPATIRVREQLYRSANWQVSKNSAPFEKLSSSEIEFRIPVPAGAEEKISYTVDYSW